MATTRTTPPKAAKQTSAAPAQRRPFRPASLVGRNTAVGRRGLALREWFQDTRSEIRKVVWPTRQEATNLTLVVLALSVIVGAFLGAVDFVFQELFRFLIHVVGAGG